MVVLCIISHHRPVRCSDHGLTPSPTLMFFSGITFALASPHWVLSGTIPCFIGPYGAGVMHLLNMREMGVGMGLMLSIFACDLW